MYQAACKAGERDFELLEKNACEGTQRSFTLCLSIQRQYAELFYTLFVYSTSVNLSQSMSGWPRLLILIDHWDVFNVDKYETSDFGISNFHFSYAYSKTVFKYGKNSKSIKLTTFG